MPFLSILLSLPNVLAKQRENRTTGGLGGLVLMFPHSDLLDWEVNVGHRGFAFLQPAPQLPPPHAAYPTEELHGALHLQTASAYYHLALVRRAMGHCRQRPLCPSHPSAWSRERV